MFFVLIGRHQAITCTLVTADFSSVRSRGIHLRELVQETLGCQSVKQD